MVVMFVVGAFLRIPILHGVLICHLRIVTVHRLTEVLLQSLASLQKTRNKSFRVIL